MSATLHLAELGLDRRELAASLLREFSHGRGQAFPAVWVLLATRRQELAFKQRLAESETGAAAHFNIEFFNFYSLNARLLKIAGAPVRRLNSQARQRLLAELLRQMNASGQLSFFQRIAETRGLVTILAELIDELKQSSIDVAAFARAARSPKDREIAEIYGRYQDTLRQSGLADIEGEGWLALATLRRKPEIAEKVDLLLVHGYDQFTPVQTEMLAALASSVAQTHISLTALPDALDAMPSRSQLARRGLQAAFDKLGLRLDTRYHAQPPGARQPALDRLGRQLFRNQPAGEADGAIKLIEMPDPAEEAKAVMRAVKRLLLDGACADGILIALRDWQRYATYFEWGRQDYGLPLLLHIDREYGSAPVIAALMDLLELGPRFRRRDMLDVLRSPYFDWGLDDSLIDLLDRLSLERRFLGGSEADWLELVKMARPEVVRARRDAGLTRLGAGQAESLADGLSALFAAVDAPQEAGLPDYVDWLAALLGEDPLAENGEAGEGLSLNIFQAAAQNAGANDDIVARDMQALRGLIAILREMLASHDVVQLALGAPTMTSWAQFLAELKHALETQADSAINQPRGHQVLLTTAAEARSLPHDHVFVLGLAEGLFPAEPSQDPLYLDSERERMQGRGIALATRAERIDDRGLFYELISLPRSSLTLSRPTFQAGKAWVESYLWRAARAAFPDAPIVKRSVGAVIRPSEAANGSELMLALADQLNQGAADQAREALGARLWLAGQRELDEAWRRLERGRSVETRRLGQAAFDEYSGILTRPQLLQEVALRLGDERTWSASQLNDFGHCPFRFFAKRLLNLSAVSEPETGLDSLQLGLLHHRILETTYRRVRARQLELDEANQDEALMLLADAADEIMPRAPELIGFRASASWTEECKLLLKRLQAAIRLDFSPQSPLGAGEPRHVLRVEERVDEFKLDLGGDLKPLRLTALIDRVDSVAGRLSVVDYKTGSRPISRDDMETGRDFQMMIYLAALESEFEMLGADEEIAGGAFWHLRNLKASGRISTEDEDDLATLKMARQHIARHIAMARGGQFPVAPSKLEDGRCSRFCEFSRLCRIQATGRFKVSPVVTES